MKTLDEVIRSLETVDNTWNNARHFMNYEDFRDGLHYLRQYQKDKQIYSYDIARRNLEVAERNDISWDELRGMQGKPVWVEMEGYKPNWGIVMNQDERNGMLLLCGYDKVPIRIEINEEGEGNTWKAYRKEQS